MNVCSESFYKFKDLWLCEHIPKLLNISQKYMSSSINMFFTSMCTKFKNCGNSKQKTHLEYQLLKEVLQKGFLKPQSSDSYSLNGIFISQT